MTLDRTNTEMLCIEDEVNNNYQVQVTLQDPSTKRTIKTLFKILHAMIQ